MSLTGCLSGRLRPADACAPGAAALRLGASVRGQRVPSVDLRSVGQSSPRSCGQSQRYLQLEAAVLEVSTYELLELLDPVSDGVPGHMEVFGSLDEAAIETQVRRDGLPKLRCCGGGPGRGAEFAVHGVTGEQTGR